MNCKGATLAWLIFVTGCGLVQLAHAQPANCIVRGTITSPAGMPVPGAIVRFDRLDNNKAYQAKTGKDGAYVRTGLPEGKYRISALTADGRLLEKKETQLTSGSDTQVDFAAREGPDFRLGAAAFANGTPIPRRFTCDGAEVSPALSWSGEPEGTRSFVLIVDDPDAPSGQFNHWLVWNIPASAHSLAEDDKTYAGTSGSNGFGRRGYSGPCPPEGRGAHRYFFRLWALDAPSVDLKAGAKRDELDRALRGHTLAKTEYRGIYLRN